MLHYAIAEDVKPGGPPTNDPMVAAKIAAGREPGSGVKREEPQGEVAGAAVDEAAQQPLPRRRYPQLSASEHSHVHRRQRASYIGVQVEQLVSWWGPDGALVSWWQGKGRQQQQQGLHEGKQCRWGWGWAHYHAGHGVVVGLG